ncbi:inner centromere protein isoform X2 [Eurosta solidaginis]|uniref:inner centromere protein isoform X2 n=1 Tax=Eurosta solidaginis TaxID=178769 RepID=UPI003530E8A1
MEELLKILETSEEYCIELQLMKEKFMDDLSAKLNGRKPTLPEAESVLPPSVTPQQTKKRVKRLSDLDECVAEALPEKVSPTRPVRISNTQLLASAVAMESEPIEDIENVNSRVPDSAKSSKEQTEEELMPPPPAPIASAQNDINDNNESSFARPQRAAKLRSEKNLKEPKLNYKLRRPDSENATQVKLEHEQRPSQMHHTDDGDTDRENTKSVASIRSEDSVIAIPPKAPSVVEINSEDEQLTDNIVSQRTSSEDGMVRGLRIKVKREKSSTGSVDGTEGANSSTKSTVVGNTTGPQLSVPMPKMTIKSEQGSDDSTLTSTSISANTMSTTANTRRRRKKDAVPKPIKVERFSDIEVSEPKRKGRKEVRVSAASVYEDAVDQPITTEGTNTPPTRVSIVPPHVAVAAGLESTMNNVTIPDKIGSTTIISAVVNDATYCANAAQTTFQVDIGQTTFVKDNQIGNVTVTMDKKSGGTCATVGDTTYNVPNIGANNSAASSHQSMETAKDCTHAQQDSLITEDESFEKEKPNGKLATLPKPGPASSKLASTKAFKMPTRTNELFNPLVQSPVKKKVEAFENAAIAAHNIELTNTGRPKRTKENTAPSSLTTPTIGKLASAPALGRFLTPTQSSNLTGSATREKKKVTSSASKALPYPKLMAGVKTSSSSTSTKTLSRENSAEDFRKGLHSLAEERKKQREQKHLIAAQQREARERERAERAAKLVKEREEKRLKKQQEAEQKKQELEDIQRNIRQQEEAAKLKASKAKAEQERELLKQMKPQSARAATTKMLPPPPKVRSTDEEDKTSYKRPPPPTWSRSHVRGPAIRMQQYWPTQIIDSFFSVQPMSPDLRLIFPNISSHHLKRNSSVLWSTPPRYSELPKY